MQSENAFWNIILAVLFGFVFFSLGRMSNEKSAMVGNDDASVLIHALNQLDQEPSATAEHNDSAQGRLYTRYHIRKEAGVSGWMMTAAEFNLFWTVASVVPPGGIVVHLGAGTGALTGILASAMRHTSQTLATVSRTIEHPLVYALDCWDACPVRVRTPLRMFSHTIRALDSPPVTPLLIESTGDMIPSVAAVASVDLLVLDARVLLQQGASTMLRAWLELIHRTATAGVANDHMHRSERKLATILVSNIDSLHAMDTMDWLEDSTTSAGAGAAPAATGVEEADDRPASPPPDACVDDFEGRVFAAVGHVASAFGLLVKAIPRSNVWTLVPYTPYVPDQE